MKDLRPFWGFTDTCGPGLRGCDSQNSRTCMCRLPEQVKLRITGRLRHLTLAQFISLSCPGPDVPGREDWLTATCSATYWTRREPAAPGLEMQPPLSERNASDVWPAAVRIRRLGRIPSLNLTVKSCRGLSAQGTFIIVIDCSGSGARAGIEPSFLAGKQQDLPCMQPCLHAQEPPCNRTARSRAPTSRSPVGRAIVRSSVINLPPLEPYPASVWRRTRGVSRDHHDAAP
jgi:hypothetical protein